MKTELLSPAGDLEAAYSAFHFGADAIYLGLRRFSARAEAVNFSPEELDEITAYAHANGKKVYVTVNTLVQEQEMPDVIQTLAVCRKCRVDAVIVQDWGVARLVRTLFPEIALHASTQMAIHNLAGALAMKKMGFSRVVLARELSLVEIKDIREKSGLEIEVFIHGALCYSYSGLCLFSSLTTGRSANRGKCVYSCRDVFKINGRQIHPFSMKDLALEKDVLKLSGLSLKIEGRKKTALYVGAVTDYYRRILDTGRIEGGLTDNLKQIFARPWTKLHLNGKQKDVIDPEFVGHRGLPIGQVDKIFNHTISVKINRPVARYDGIQIDVPGAEKPFGFSAEALTVGGKKVFEAMAGQTVTFGLPEHHPFIQKGNTVYLASSTRVKGAYPYEKPRPGAYKNRNPIDVDVFIESDKVTAVCGDKSADLAGVFDVAKQPEKVVDSVRKAFDKTGDTVLSLENLQVHNPKGLFVPASQLNELRRLLYEQIEVVEPAVTLPKVMHLKTTKTKPSWIVKTDDLSIAQHIQGCDEIIYVLKATDTPEKLQSLSPKNIRLALPTILRPEQPWHRVVDSLIKAGYRQWEIGNPAGLSLLPKGADVSLDCSVSVLNTLAAEEAIGQGISRFTFSPEDTGENIRMLASKTSQTALILYQDPPLFLSANCIRENDCRVCPKGRLEMPLSNRQGQYTLISENCQTTVVPQEPLALPVTAQEIPVGAFRVDFCWRRYTMEEAQKILDDIKGKQKIIPSFSGNFEKQFAS